MAISSTTTNYGLYSSISQVTDGTTLSGEVGKTSQRLPMPLVDIEYTIDIGFDGSGDAVTIDTETGIATGDVVGVKATGTITFTGLPVEDETITVNGIVYTFKTAAVTAVEITIGADATEMASNTAAKIDANQTLTLDAVNVSGVVTVSAKESGTYGNAYTLAEAATNTAVSGATLTGGVDKVEITGDGVDSLGDALATATKIHGILVTTTAGGVTAEITGAYSDSVSTTGGSLTFDSAGRTDLIGDLVITSTAANTVAKVIIRASE
jgi:hypothetical protein